MKKKYKPLEVMPRKLGKAVADISYWFVIGGHAVRCFCPYRPSRDVDFGVSEKANMEEFIKTLESRGKVEILEQTPDTAHMLFNGLNVSIFVLDKLAPHVEDQCLNLTGILATKLHAILDRGTRRDFFDLYVTMQVHGLGIAECLDSVARIFQQPVNENLLLRALTYFDDAEREAVLPGEGSKDWDTVKDFFLTRVGSLLVPPSRKLEIQKNSVDVNKSD